MDSCTVYFSSSVEPFHEQEMALLLKKSRSFNSTCGITGVLLYIRGSFLQVLEGESLMVDSLYGRIQRDRRHRDIYRIFNRPIVNRLFSDWSMGYETMTTLQLDCIKLVIESESKAGVLIDTSEHVILRMIRMFYHSNQHNQSF